MATLRSTTDSKQRNESVQIVRAIAVVSVLLFHLFPKSFPNGYLGVDVFFVVSGFVVTPLLRNVFINDHELLFKLWNFFRRRFFRLFPAFAFTVALSLFFVFNLGPVWDHERMSLQAVWSTLLIGNFGAYRFSAGDYFDPNPNPLVHLWSLSAEEQIYLILPILLFMLSRLIRTRRDWVVLFCLLLLIPLIAQHTIFPAVFQNFGFRNVDGIIFYSPFSYIWKFALGGLLTLIASNSPNSSRKGMAAGLMWTSVGILVILLITPIKELTVEYAVLLITGVLLWNSINHRISYTGIFAHFLSTIGDRSYSIYLVHLPIIYIFQKSPYFYNLNPSLKILFVTLSIILVSETSYRQFEQRFRLKASNLSENQNRLKFKGFEFLIVPLFVSIAILGFTKFADDFFQRDQLPKYAGSEDQNCDRISSAKPCVYKIRNAYGTSLLLGDSVSMSYSHIFIRTTHARKQNAITYGFAGCPFVLRQTLGNKYQNLMMALSLIKGNNSVSCLDHNDKVLNYVKEVKPKRIYISQLLDDTKNVAALGMDDFQVMKLLAANVAHLQKYTKEVVVIGSSPQLDRKTLVGVPTLWDVVGDKRPVRINELQDNFYGRDDQHIIFFKNANIKYQSTLALMCPREVCPVISSGQWLYRDTSHLSVIGANRLYSIFQ